MDRERIQVDPVKMLAYLKGRTERLEADLHSYRIQVCLAVNNGLVEEADALMDKILWKTAAQMATLDEYIQETSHKLV